MEWILIAFFASVAGGWAVRKQVSKSRVRRIQAAFQKKRAEAVGAMEQRREKNTVSIENEIRQSRHSFEREAKNKNNEIRSTENRIKEKEKELEQKKEKIQQLMNEKEAQKAPLQEAQDKLNALQEEWKQVKNLEESELEKICGRTREELKQEKLRKIEEEIQSEADAYLKLKEEESREAVVKEAEQIIEMAIQRTSVSHTTDGSSAVVALPNDEMKGRVIGKEGRNIQTLELVTGAEFVLDQIPGTVQIQSPDPMRREVARRAVERLIEDGRINPTRIEEVVRKTKEEVEEMVLEAGEDVLYKLKIKEVHPDIIRLLGKLKFASNHGQNVLLHLKETAYLTSLMAAEIGLDTDLAKRAGLFHDIGKSIEKEVEASHDVVGAEIAKRYGEDPVLINAIEAHHDTKKSISPISDLIAAANAISGSRPGARTEKAHNYMNRIETIEKVASSFKGVDRCYCMQGGRELRVIVNPKIVNDHKANELARNITKKIKESLEFPGDIKVIVIRETRTVESTR